MKRILAGMLLLVGLFGCGTSYGVTRTWTGAVNGKWSVTNNWNPAGVPIATDFLAWDATSTNNTVSTNDYSSLSVTQLYFSTTADGIILNGSNLTVVAATPLVGATAQEKATINMNLTLPASTNIAIGDFGGLTINGNISGAAPLIAINKGAYALNGLNSFTGNVVLANNSGVSTVTINTLTNIGVEQSLGKGSVIQFGGINSIDRGYLIYVGNATTTDKGFQIGGPAVSANNSQGGVYANGSGPLVWNGVQSLATTVSAKPLTLGGFNTDDNTWQGVIGNNNGATVGVTKEGRGRWVLSGANTFTGTTAGVTVNSGTLVLDYANTATVVNPSNKVTLLGGTLELKGNASGTSQTFIPSMGLGGPSGLSTIKLDDVGAPGTTLTFSNTPTVGLTSLYALLYDRGHASNSIVVAQALPGTTPPFRHVTRDANGNVDFAANAGANTPVSNLTANVNLTVGGNQSGNYVLTNSLEVTGGVASKLRIVPATSNLTLTLKMADPLTNSVLVTTLFVGSHDFTITQAGGQTGSMGNNTTPSTSAYLYHFGTGKLTLDTKLAGDCNSTSTLSGGVVEFYGTGLIDWTRPANSSSNVLVAGVVLRQSGSTGQKLDNSATGLGSGNIMLANGGLLEVSDATIITRNVGTGSGAIQWLSDGGFSAYGGDRAVNLGGVGATQTWASGGFVPANNALVLCRTASTNSIDFRNPLNLGGQQRVVLVNDGGATVDAKLSGVLSGSFGGGLVKEGNGTLELTAANTFPGATWVKAGTLRVSGSTGTGVQGVPDGGLVTVFTNAVLTGTGTVHHLAFNRGGKLTPYMTGAGTPSKLRVTGSANFSNGTLDLSGLGTLPDGDLSIVQCGSRIGTFAATNGLPSDRQITYTGTSIILKDVSPQGFQLIVH